MRSQDRPILASPSLMCADWLNLEREIALFETRSIPLLHIDIMDGHYVPNFTLGPDFCERIAARTTIPLDIHLMIEDVDRYALVFATSVSPYISFHPEVSRHPMRTIALIRSLGARPGIALDPAVPVEQYRHLYPEVDMVCVMTVNPGYAGQKLIPSTLGKITELRSWLEREGLDALIQVDGNVSWANIPAIVRAGGEVLVLGSSSLFSREQNREASLERLDQSLAALRQELGRRS